MNLRHHTSYSTAGRVQAGEQDCFIRPLQNWSGTRPLLVYAHGAGQDTSLLWDEDDPAGGLFIRQLATFYPMVVTDLGGALTFGNDLSLTRMGQAITWGRSFPGVDPTLLFGCGTSGGALVLLNYAKANPGVFERLALFIAGLDLNDLYTRDVFGMASDIDAAYGGTYVDATERADHNPAYIAAQPGNALQGLPIATWYSENDTICLPSIEATFAAQPGMTVTRHSTGTSAGPAGHSFDDDIDPDDVLAFLGGT